MFWLQPDGAKRSWSWFTPSDEEIAWARDNTATDPHLLALAVWLKSLIKQS